VKRIDELYRDLPEGELPAPSAAAPPVPARPRSAPWILTLVLVLACLAVLALPRPASRAGEARFRAELERALRHYRLDWGKLPPGDGRGSAGLAAALAAPGPFGGTGYLPPGPCVDADGHLRSPSGRRVRYRPGDPAELAFDGDAP
jgi:hypothetical protein